MSDQKPTGMRGWSRGALVTVALVTALATAAIAAMLVNITERKGEAQNSFFRVVELTAKASGEGAVTVTRKVIDARGRTVPGSTAIEHASIIIGESRVGLASRREYDTKVEKAERRYPDMPAATWPLDGLKVKLAIVDGANPQTLEIRFDTPEGSGSFWETLRRVAATAKRAAP